MIVDGLFRHAVNSQCHKVMTLLRVASLGTTGMKLVTPRTAKKITDLLPNTTGLLTSSVVESQAKTLTIIEILCSSMVTMIHGTEEVST